jgi:HAMP domain-containing protein
MSSIRNALDTPQGKRAASGDTSPKQSVYDAVAQGHPSDAVTDDLWGRIEAALAQWDTQVTDTYVNLVGRLGKAREQLAAFAERASAQEPDLAVLAEARTQIEALTEALAQRDAAIETSKKETAALEKQVGELTREVQAALESARQESAAKREYQTELNMVRAERARVQDQLENASAFSEKIRALEDLVRTERARADLLEDQLAEWTQEQQSALSKQLAAALRDRDEAHQEIVSLRAEIEMLRRANASLISPVRAEASHETPAPIEVLDAEGRKRRMGEILLGLGLLTADQLEAAIHEQAAAPQRRLGTILVGKGFASEDAVAQVLARQLSLPFVRLTRDVVDSAAPRLIPAQLARRRTCMPIAISSDRVVLAMANPLDLIALDDVELASGRRVDPVVATPSDIQAALGHHYGTV